MGDYWDVTITTLQPLIAKPTLKAALLQKPPFRFLHDIVTAVMAATGFGTGLYADDQLKSDQVKEKEQKLAFLNRLQAAVQLAIGREIDVNSTKIIAGLEPEKTNALLQGLAEAARNAANINMQDIVAGVDSGARPGAAKAAAPAPAAAAAAPAPAAAAPKRAPAAAAAAAPAASGALRPTRAPIQLPDGAGGEDFVATTTRLVGSLVQKPKMVDKLLRKPPFRFIHDIITAVMAATSQKQQQQTQTHNRGPQAPIASAAPDTLFSLTFCPALLLFFCVTAYPEGYFTPEELDSGNFAETNAKLSFLQRLIDLVATTNSVDLSQVNPKKIAAGLEPEHTNTLLQQFAYAAASGISARDVAAKLASGGGAAPAPAALSPGNDRAAEEAEAARKAKAAADAEARKAAALAASEKERAAQAAAAAQQQQQKPMPKLGLTNLSGQDQSEGASSTTDANQDDAQVRTKIERPKTARKAPPKLPSNLIDEKKSDSSAASGSASLAAASSSEEKKSNEPLSRVIAEGDNVADADDDDDEDDGGHTENLMGEALAGFADEGGAGDDGLLVRGMKSKLKEADGASGGGGMKIRSSQSMTGGMSQGQVDELRKQVQLLCQSVNPLGKCIDFVRDDMDSMNKELQRWRGAYNEYTEQLEMERKSTERIVEPLTQQLADVELHIAEQQRKIHALKATILRNDSTIQQLLDAKTAVTS